MQEYCLLFKSVRKPHSPHCTGQCFITDTQRLSSAHLIESHLMVSKSAHPHLTWLWVHTFPLLQTAFLKNPEISLAGESMVLLIPRLWIWSLYGPFTEELNLMIPMASSNSQYSVIVWKTCFPGSQTVIKISHEGQKRDWGKCLLLLLWSKIKHDNYYPYWLQTQFNSSKYWTRS